MRIIEFKSGKYEDIYEMLEKISKYASCISKLLEEKESGWHDSHSINTKSDDSNNMDNRYSY